MEQEIIKERTPFNIEGNEYEVRVFIEDDMVTKSLKTFFNGKQLSGIYVEKIKISTEDEMSKKFPVKIIDEYIHSVEDDIKRLLKQHGAKE